MPLQTWDTAQYSFIGIVLMVIVGIILTAYAIFKVRKHNILQFIVAFLITIIFTLVAVFGINFLSPKQTNMYYKYENAVEVKWLTEAGWELEKHYVDRSIVLVSLKAN